MIDVTILVKDSGIGIDDADHGKIFSDFVQAKNQGEKLHQGTGLGLSICKKLLTMMNGDLTVKSKLGTGSTFKISLPAIEVYNEQKHEAKKSITAPVN